MLETWLSIPVSSAYPEYANIWNLKKLQRFLYFSLDAVVVSALHQKYSCAFALYIFLFALVFLAYRLQTMYSHDSQLTVSQQTSLDFVADVLPCVPHSRTESCSLSFL